MKSSRIMKVAWATAALCMVFRVHDIRAQEPMLPRLDENYVDLTRSLDLKLFPADAEELEVTQSHASVLKTAGTELRVLPLTFEVPGRKGEFGNFRQCGITFVPANGPQYYVPLFGQAHDPYHSECNSPDGVGMMMNDGKWPRLIIFCAVIMNKRHPEISAILRWSNKTKKYDLDAKLTKWVFDTRNRGPHLAYPAEEFAGLDGTRQMLRQYDSEMQK